MSSFAREVKDSAFVLELKMACALVTRRPPVALPRDPKRRNARLMMLLAAERRRNADLIEGLR